MQINFFSDIMINKLLTKIIYRKNNENKLSIPIKNCICKYIYTDKYIIIKDENKNKNGVFDIRILLIPPIITINKLDQICLNIVNYTERKERGYAEPLKTYKSSLYKLCKSYLQIKGYHNDLNFIELNYGLLYDNFINKSCNFKLKDIFKYFYSNEWCDIYFNKHPSYKIININEDYEDYEDELKYKFKNYNTNNTILNDYKKYIKNNYSRRWDIDYYTRDNNIDIFEYNKYIKYKYSNENDIALLTNEDREYLLFQYINAEEDTELVYIDSDIDINNNSIQKKKDLDSEYAYTIFRKKINIIQELNKLINYDFNINNYNNNEDNNDNKDNNSDSSDSSNDSEKNNDSNNSDSSDSSIDSEYYAKLNIMTDAEYECYIVYLD
jgi:hypothetical protein